MINVSKNDWAGTRAELERAVVVFKLEIENHKKTVGVPAPLCDIPIVEEIVNSNGYFILQSELKWVWSSNGIGNFIKYRRLDFKESPAIDEFEIGYEPVGYILDADGVTIRAETEDEILPKVIEERQKYINKERNKYIASGVTFNGWDFDTDTVSINNITAAVAFIKSAPDAGLTPPATISWRDATNVDRDLTVVQLISLGAVVFQRIQEAHFKARQLKDLIATCISKEEVMAIDW
jgi:hypothetical protein